MNDYINKMRSSIGKDKFIHPGARIIIENANNEVLIIERRDNGKMGIPAGSLEEEETIAACIKREVWEETGLTINDLQVIGISSNPTLENVVYPNGDNIQYFTIEFYSNNWNGAIKIRDKNEVKRVAFMARDVISQLPKNELSAFESLAYFKKNQKIMLK